MHGSSGIRYRITDRGRKAEWWLPLDIDQPLEPDFTVEIALTEPRIHRHTGTRVWPTGWTPLETLVDEMYRTVTLGVLPQLREFF
jgi:hypothetical protein